MFSPKLSYRLKVLRKTNGLMDYESLITVPEEFQKIFAAYGFKNNKNICYYDTVSSSL
jgi:hypothetical protein